MEDIGPNSCTGTGGPVVAEKKARPQEQVNCPRCSSTNTKFCYYNNYSLTQPRYFCKTCRRYWTEGGSLRNVPVGGGSRKNKRVLSTSSSKVPDLNPPPPNPKVQQGLHDLNLAFPAAMDHKYHHGIAMSSPYVEIGAHDHSTSHSPTAVELLRSGMASRGFSIPYASNSLYTPAGYPMQQEIKPNLSFSVDGFGNRSYGVQENGGGRLLFPFGEIKHLSAGVEVEHNKEQANNPTGYWTGIIGEGSSW